MQTHIDLFDETRFGFDTNLLVTALLQTFNLERQPRILAVDGAQDLPIIQRIAIRALFFVKVGPGHDGVDQVAFVLHQPQCTFKMRLSRVQIERFTQSVHALVQIRLGLNLAINGGDEG